MPDDAAAGRALSHARTVRPGSRSRQLAEQLRVLESPNITRIDEHAPIFWAEAHGAIVRDVDDNEYIDLTAGFGVAMTGHANPRVAAAIAAQAARLAHAMGDVYPADIKTRLLERLASIAPGRLSVSILGSSGSDAVEAALKTAVMHTGRPGIVAFEGGYHGLSYGALATTWRAEFRAPFAHQLFHGVRFAPFPAADGADPERHAAESIDAVRAHIETAHATDLPIGAVLVEPVLGRGGLVVPVQGFLTALRALCDDHDVVLIFDEVYTGFGRTGRWFACQHERVLPDVLAVGKALTGSVPLSAAIGTPEVMSAWPVSTGEALHTSTFLGNPIACAAAIAQIEEIETRNLIARAGELGHRIRARIDAWPDRYATVKGTRGIGLMQGVVMVARNHAAGVAQRALRAGVLVLPEGPAADVIAMTPPAVITDRQVDEALDRLETVIEETPI